MSGTFIIDENADIEKVKITFVKIYDFVSTTVDTEKEFNKLIDNIGSINKMDEKFIDEHAGDFGHELREVGVKGLKEEYTGRYCINIYGQIPFWLIMTMESLLGAHYLQCKCKPKSSW